jgi:DNA-binding NtrC family response regulator
MTKPLILLTDDDHAVVAGYKRHLRQHYRLVTASGGREAVDVMQSEMPDAVVSDLHMPMMNGVSVLSEARRLAPKALRILLTGQPQLDNTIDAINKGEIYKLLLKPCPTEAIIKTIDEGLRRRLSSGSSSLPSESTLEADLVLTAHAATRRQQRAVPPIVIEWLIRFGAQRWSRGAAVYEFDKGSRRRLRRHIGRRLFASIEDLLSAYVVIGDDQRIVTVGWRH